MVATLLVAGLLLAQSKAPVDGLVGHWKLDGAEGEAAADSSGKGNPGKHVGGVKSTLEVPKGFVHSRSLFFDGKDGRVQVGEGAILAMKGALTLAVWVRPTENSESLQMIVNKEGEYELWRSPEGKLQVALANRTPGWNFNDTGVTLSLNTWKHLAWTYSAADSTLKVYADGKEIASEVAEGDIGDVYEGWNQLWIGGRQRDEGKEFFTGQICDVRLYNRALKPEEIAAIYAASFRN
jgi:hypothetical protein